MQSADLKLRRIAGWRALTRLAPIALALSVWGMGGLATAQDARLGSIGDRIAVLEKNTANEPSAGVEIAPLLDAARKNLAEARTRQAEDAAFAAEANTAASEVSALQTERVEVESAVQEFDAALWLDGQPASDLDARILTANAELAAARADVDRLTSVVNNASARPGQITRALGGIRTTGGRTSPALPSSDVGAASLPEEARAIVRESEAAAQLANEEALETELATGPSRLSVINARLELATARASLGQLQVTALQSARGNVARSNAERLLTESKRQADLAAPDAAQPRNNVALAERLGELVSFSAALVNSQARVDATSNEIQSDAQTVGQVLDTGAVSNELGQLLRGIRQGLPDPSALRREIAELDRRQVDLELDRILWRKDKQATRPDAGDAPDLGNPDALHRALVAEALNASDAIEAQIAALRISQRTLLVRRTDLAETLDRRLLWLPNNDPLTAGGVAQMLRGSTWLVSPANWLETAQALAQRPLVAGGAMLLAALVFLVISAARTGLTRRLGVLATRVGDVGSDGYGNTPRALLISMILAARWPSLAAGAAGAVGLAVSGSEELVFSSALAAGFAALAAVLFFLLLIRVACREDGLFHSHFGWSNHDRKLLRSALSWFGPVQGAAAFVFATAAASGVRSVELGAGVPAFVVASLAMGVLAFRLFHPRHGIGHPDGAEGRRSSILLTLAFPFLVILPVATGLAPFFGYFDTSVEIQSRAFTSGLLLVAGASIYGLVMREMLVSHRRSALRRALAKRALDTSQRAAKAANPASGDAVPELDIDQGPGLGELSAQLRTTLLTVTAIVLGVTLLNLWSPLIPALGVIDDVVLWHRATDVAGGVGLSDVTLWNLIFGIAAFVLAIVLAQNIRSLLDGLLFQRITMDAGARFALVTLSSYVVIAVGVLMASYQLGVDWSKLQWIIAALGVGLGFGLQEIVANFISGLIILFERPIRIGDTVTIGDVSGTVTRMQIRATTITDWDNREILIPNKTVITDNVTNWTLNNPTTRLFFKVGVAYGSDTQRVQELLLKAVKQTEHVRSDPEPTVFFTGFGDSALDFEVRAFVSTLALRLPVTHALHSAVERALREAGIEIPFPQRDLHLKVSGQKAPGESDGYAIGAGDDDRKD